MNYKLFFFYEVPFVVSLLEFDRETTFWAVFVVSLLSFDRETTLLGANWQKGRVTICQRNVGGTGFDVWVVSFGKKAK